MGVDSEDSICRRCLGAVSRSSSFASGYESGGSTLVPSRSLSDASNASMSSADTLVQGMEKVRIETDVGRETFVWLTVPAGATAKQTGRSCSVVSSRISSSTSAAHARSLMASLPLFIPKMRRNASGVGISSCEYGQKAKAQGPAPNMHWRGYHDAVYEETCAAAGRWDPVEGAYRRNMI